MPIQYVTGRQMTTFVPTNKLDLANQIETVLLAAGWTTISGHNTTNLLMETATTPQGLKIRVRFKDNSGTCLTISIENAAGSVVGANSTAAGGGYLNPGASTKTYRIIANKYQAFIFTGIPTPAREFCAFGVPYIPSFLVGVITTCGWMCCNSVSDTDTTIRASWRTQLGCVQFGIGNCSNQQGIVNSSLMENANAAAPSSGAGLMRLFTPVPDDGVTMVLYRWHDDSPTEYDAWIGWGLASEANEAKWRAQLWDAMIASESYTGDNTTTADSHNWFIVTDANVGSLTHWQRGTLLLATP
jgi:hypothetical protein